MWDLCCAIKQFNLLQTGAKQVKGSLHNWGWKKTSLLDAFRIDWTGV